MASPGSHHWVREYFLRTIASAEFRDLEDYQYGWLCRLRSHAHAREGYLPTDVSELWRLAGAKTMRYFEEKSQSVLAYFDGRTVDGLRMFNSFDLRELKECRKKLRLPEEDMSLSLPGIGVSLVDPEDQSVTIEKLFAFYCALFQRDPARYRLSALRSEKAGTRLWERIKANHGDRAAAAQDCRDAIANLRLSDWHCQNGHIDWVDHIFRSQEVFEKRLEMGYGGERALKRQPKSEPYAIEPIAVAPAPVLEQHIAADSDPWRHVLDALKTATDQHSFDTWLKPTRFYALVEGTLYVRVPTPEFRSVVRGKYGEKVHASLSVTLGRPMEVVYVTADEARARAKEAV
jgi:hypothetical protein